jgi:hypothetical protein
MALFKLTIVKNQIPVQKAWLDKLIPTINDPRVMDVGVKYIGMEMLNNFRAEGSHAGHQWKELSLTTQRVRKRRGYNPEHPILVQSGDLRRMSADALRGWSIGTAAQVETDGKTAMIAYTSSREFKARIGGPKVANHWGGTVKLKGGGSANLPQRRFFGITSVAAEKASQAISDKIMTDWGKKSSLTKRA